MKITFNINQTIYHINSMFKFSTLSFLLACIFNASIAQVTVTLNPSTGNLKDALVANETPNSNWGSHLNTEATTWTCSSVLCNGRTLFQFDYSSIPVGSIIHTAELKLIADLNAVNCITGQPTYGANQGYVRRVTQSWNENTVTWNNQPTFTSLGEVLVPASTSTAQNYSVDLTVMVQDFVNDPANDFGFIVMLADEIYYYKSLIFGSNDNPDTSLAPRMVISYTPPAECLEFVLNEDGYDALIATEYPNLNYITHPSNEVITWTCNSILCLGRSLIKFDLSTIPSTAIVDSAFLELSANINNANGMQGSPMYGPHNSGLIQRITQSWNPNNVTWNSQPTSTSVGEVTLPQSSSIAEDYRVNIISLVQDMVSNPSTNYGMLMRQIDEVDYYNSLIFSSGDDSDPAKRPKLKVCFRATTSISENSGSIHGMQVYPNPFSESASLVFYTDKFTERINLDIFDISGRIVQKSSEQNVKIGRNEISLNKGKLASGIYFIRLTSNQNEFKSLKFIVE